MIQTVTQEQMDLLEELADRGNCEYLKYAVKGVELDWFQNLVTAFALIVKKCIISLDTGLGKTLVATGLMNIISQGLYRDEVFKWIFVVENTNLRTTAKKVERGLYGMKVAYCSGDSKEVLEKFFYGPGGEADVAVITYQGLCNEYLNDFLFENQELYRGMIVDESHTIGNGDSITALTVSSILATMEYGFMLTATPLRINPGQMINQVYMLDRKMFADMSLKRYKDHFLEKEDGKVIGFRNLDELRFDLWYRFVGFTRAELGLKGEYQTFPIICEPLEEYNDVSKMDAFRVIKGDMEGPAIQALAEVVGEHTSKGDKGIVYINLTDNKIAVQEYLEHLGYRVGILDGTFTPKQEDKDRVQEQFVSGELDVLITNITTGKDLPCQYIVFYELTFDVKQFIGRGERGLKGNDLCIYFIIVAMTSEVLYFYDNVYKRGLLLETLASKDVEELKEAYKQLEPYIAEYRASHNY